MEIAVRDHITLRDCEEATHTYKYVNPRRSEFDDFT